MTSALSPLEWLMISTRYLSGALAGGACTVARRTASAAVMTALASQVGRARRTGVSDPGGNSREADETGAAKVMGTSSCASGWGPLLDEALGDAEIRVTTAAGSCRRVRPDELDAERVSRPCPGRGARWKPGRSGAARVSYFLRIKSPAASTPARAERNRQQRRFQPESGVLVGSTSPGVFPQQVVSSAW
jgi:hypothetical protein